MATTLANELERVARDAEANAERHQAQADELRDLAATIRAGKDALKRSNELAPLPKAATSKKDTAAPSDAG